MYWKTLTAVLCFYAVVPVPPTTTTAANTTTTADNTTTTAANTTTTAANTTTTADNTTTTAANTTTTAANTTTTATNTPTTTPPPPVVLNLVFSSDEVFNPVLTNTSSPLFQSQVKKTLDALEPLFKKRFRNFIRIIVLGFRSGSIITDTQLEFAADNTTANATTPFADAVAATLKDAIANGSLSINISSTFNVTVQPTPTTAAPTPTREAPTTTRANNITTTVANTTTTAANTTTTAANNTTTAANTTTTAANITTTAANKTTTATNITTTVANTTTTAANTTTTAANNTTTAANTTTTAANITTTAVPTTTTATPTTKPPPLVVLKLVFSSDEVFNPVLTNTSSPLFQSQVKKTLNALEPLFKKRFRNFIRMIVLGFRSGSIITDTQLEFAADNTTANATTPVADAVAATLKDAIANGSLSINISSTFNVTVQPTPTTAAPTPTREAPTTTTANNITTTVANTTTTAANTTTTAANNTTTAANTTTTAANITTTAVPTTTTATPTTKPTPLVVLKLVFSSDEVFNPVLTNTSSPLFQSQVKKTLDALEPLFKKRFRNFIRMIVLGFRSGSIITDTQLEFAADNTTANATTPFADAVAATLKDAIANGSLSINISSTFNVTVQPTPTTAAPTPTREAPTTTTANNITTTVANTTTTAANTTTTAANNTTTAANTTTTAANITTTAVPTTTTATPTTKPTPLVVLKLVFSSDEVFNPVLTNTSSPLFQSQVKKTLDALEPLFKKRFRNFIRMIVLGFRSGSIITDTQLEFAADNTTANATTPFADAVAATLKDAIANGSLSINISSTFNVTVQPTPTTAAPTPTREAPTTTTANNITTTVANTTTTAANTTTTAANNTTTAANTTTTAANITTTAVPTTTTATPTTKPPPLVVLKLVFSSDEVFNPVLTNTSSPLFQSQVKKTLDALEPLFKGRFRNFIRMIVLGFRRGSIITDSQLEFAADNTTANATTPFADAVAATLKDAIANGSLSINISITFNITVVATPTTEPSTTTTGASPSTTTTGASPPTTTTGASPSTTTTGASPPTTTTGASPPTTTTAATSSTTTTAAPPPTTTTAAFAPTTTAAPNVLLLVFSSDEVFVDSLSNNNSKAFRDRAAAVKNAIEPLYRKVFRSFIQLVVLRFRSGSIVTFCRMEFGLTGDGTAPTANSVKNVLADAVKNGNLSIRVIENSITVTEEQIEYFIVNSSMSAVVNSVLSSFGMTLVFLLLSAAMHIL